MIAASRSIRSTVAAAMLAFLLVVADTAAAPPGPRLAVVKETWNPRRTKLLTVDPDGKNPVRLAGGQEQDGPVGGFGSLSWRPDGTEVAFGDIVTLYLASADGRGTRLVNAVGAERPVFAPDGRTLAFTRRGDYENETSIWTIDLTTWEQRQLTPWRRGLTYDASSFSPDGATLLATRVDYRRSGYAEPVALRLDTGHVTRLLADGLEPVYSPDGTEIALFRGVGQQGTTDLFVLDGTSGALRRLTRTQSGYELFASWDPSGERIAFARFRGGHFEWANSIHQINADGSCETVILEQKRTIFFGPVWQPGPGREAGRIEC